MAALVEKLPCVEKVKRGYKAGASEVAEPKGK